MAIEAEVISDSIEAGTSLVPAEETSLAIGLSRAEIDVAIATARRFPRSLAKVSQNILSLATLDDETADECMYALPRGGKPITGPSIRFAEIIESCWGNCRSASRILGVDRAEKVVIAEGVFHDLEANKARQAQVRRRIVNKYGKLYNDDMIIQTGNAAASIAMRNAILAGVPKAIWRRAFEAVQRTIAGDATTLAVTREKAVKALATFGATPEQVFRAIGVAGIDDVKLDHIPILRGMFSALKNGEATAEEVFFGHQPAERQTIANPLLEEHVNSETGEVSRASGEPQSDAAAEASPTHASAADEAGATGGEPDGPTIAATNDQLFEYSAALFRGAQPDSLEKIKKSFWKGKPHNFDQASTDKLVAIYSVHVRRCRNVVNADACTKEVAAIIEGKQG